MRSRISLIIRAGWLALALLMPLAAFAQDATKPIQPSQDPVGVNQESNAQLTLRDNTPVEIELAYTVTSATAQKGEAISFRVVAPVKIDGVEVISAGALATGRVVAVKGRGRWGRAGRLSISIENVVATDGQIIPLGSTTSVRGEGSEGEVAVKSIVTGLLLWPIAPVALLHGFKRGEHAVLPEGKRITVFVKGELAIKATFRSRSERD